MEPFTVKFPKTDGPVALWGRPPREISRSEVRECAERVLRYREHLLLLPEEETVTEIVAELVAVGEAAEDRTVIAVSAPGTPYQATVAIGQAIAQLYGAQWEPRAGERYLDVLSSFLGLLSDLELPRRGQGPLLVITGLSEQATETIFARGRDEAWGWDLQTFIVAPKEDLEHFLLGVSDNYFLDNIFFVGS